MAQRPHLRRHEFQYQGRRVLRCGGCVHGAGEGAGDDAVDGAGVECAGAKALLAKVLLAKVCAKTAMDEEEELDENEVGDDCERW